MKGWLAVAIFTIAMGSLAAPPAVDAAERGIYVGLAYGKARSDLSVEDANPGDFDRESDTDSSYSFAAGYRFSRHLAAEFSYLEFGTTVFRGPIVLVVGDPPQFFDAEEVIEAQTEGPALSV